MWTYRQRTGELIDAAGEIVALGYSGHGEGKNNPAMEASVSVGPIPRGAYTVLTPHDTTTHGPFVMTLSPAPGNAMHLRSGFLIHGDNSRHDASLGCIILGRNDRERIWRSGDHALQVVE